MKKMILIILMFLPSLARSDGEMTGNKLLELMESNIAHKKAFAKGFVTGIGDSISYYKVLHRADIGVCIPDGVSYTQMNDIVLNYLQREPRERHKSGFILVIDSLHGAFPCSKNNAL